MAHHTKGGEQLREANDVKRRIAEDGVKALPELLGAVEIPAEEAWYIRKPGIDLEEPRALPPDRQLPGDHRRTQAAGLPVPGE